MGWAGKQPKLTNKTNNKTKHTADTLEINAKKEIHPVFRRADIYMTYIAPGNKGRAQSFPRPSEGINTLNPPFFFPRKEKEQINRKI